MDISFDTDEMKRIWEEAMAQANAAIAATVAENERRAESAANSKAAQKREHEEEKKRQEANRVAKIEAEKQDKFGTIQHVIKGFLLEAKVMEAMKTFLADNANLTAPWKLDDVRITLAFGKTADSGGYNIFIQNSTANTRIHRNEIDSGNIL